MSEYSSHKALAKLKKLSQRDLRAKNLNDCELRQITAANIKLDYTRSLVDDEVLSFLTSLASVANLTDKFTAMFNGVKINVTEDRAVSHTNERATSTSKAELAQRARMLDLAEELYQGKVKGHTKQTITDILHIGIGGSYLGPKLLFEAVPASINCHFVANVDPAALAEKLKVLHPATTLVVCVTKSGGTIETLDNTKHALSWLTKDLGDKAVSDHLIVVSVDNTLYKKLGAKKEYYFAMNETVGGRYSLWSAAAISAASSYGKKAFTELLQGAQKMDEHVGETQGFDNIAVTLALLHLWHTLSTKSQTHCVVAYQHRLRSLPAYLQQLIMESNGKSITLDGKDPACATSAVWWGGEGTCDQHSYFQFLLQGMHTMPIDFIFASKPHKNEDPKMHQQLIAHCLGQSRALYEGLSEQQCYDRMLKDGVKEDVAKNLAVHKKVKGGLPCNLISMEYLEPKTIGSLIAMYEHMTVALGWILQINSFDQWGVEFGKSNFKQVLHAIEQKDYANLDPSTKKALEDLD